MRREENSPLSSPSSSSPLLSSPSSLLSLLPQKRVGYHPAVVRIVHHQPITTQLSVFPEGRRFSFSPSGVAGSWGIRAKVRMLGPERW